jgi:predicted PurR-regulated permease PerM
MNGPPTKSRAEDHAYPLGPREAVRRISASTTIAVIAAVVVFFYLIRVMLLPFVLAGALAFVCSPLVDWLAARTHLPRSLFAVGVSALLFAIAVIVGLVAVPPLVGGVKELVTSLGGTVESLARLLIGNETVHILGEDMNAAAIGQALVTGVRDWLGQADRLAILATYGFASMFGLLLTLILFFYFLIGGPRIGGGLFSLVPPKQRPLVEDVWLRLDPLLKRYFAGVLLVVIYTTAAAYAGLELILRLPHATFLAVLTGFLEMIPVIGPALSAVIAGLVAIHYAAGIGNIIAYAIYATALRLSIDEMVGPLILGRAGRVPPVLVIFCFLAGGTLFGIVGIIVAVPVALTIKVTLATLYREPLSDEEEPKTIG